MRSNTKRRARILRARLIEHRAATARWSQAQNSFAKLLGVEGRIRSLQSEAHVPAGTHEGVSILATGEMQMRLAKAGEAIAASKAEARTEKDEREQIRLLANQREEAAAKLHRKSCAEDEETMERAIDANRPRIRKFRKIGE